MDFKLPVVGLAGDIVMRIWLAIFLILSVSVLPVSVQATDPATRMAGVLAAARSMEATFEQEVVGGNGMLAQSTSGTMRVSRPHLFRWDVQEPFAQLIIADGTHVWVYDPDLAQVVVRPFDQQLADTPALLFGGDANRIGERFTVKLLEDAGNRLHFELTPKDEDSLFETLTVRFHKKRLKSMTLVDGLGQKTTIRFSDVVLNVAIPPENFRFVPPPGTDVIREGG